MAWEKETIWEKEIICLACGHQYDRLDILYGKYDRKYQVCYYCGHVFENIGGKYLRLSDSVINIKLYSNLFEITKSKGDINNCIKVLSNYVSYISRPCFDKRFHSEILSTTVARDGRYPSDNVLYYGVPLGHQWNDTEGCFYEYWIDRDSHLISNRITARGFDKSKRNEHLYWGNELDVEVVGDVTTNDKLFNEISNKIESNCREYMYRYADKKLNIQLLTPKQKITLILEFYFNKSENIMFSLCWDSLNQIVSQYEEDETESIDLLVQASMEKSLAGNLSDVEFKVLSNFVEKDSLVKLFAKIIKMRKSDISMDFKTKIRQAMHDLDAKALIGWCPCNKCIGKSKRRWNPRTGLH